MRHRVACFAAILGVAGMLTVGAAGPGPGGGPAGAATTAGPKTPTAFARSALDAAPVPPGGHPTGDVETVVPTWMSVSPGQPATSGYADIHALYLYAEPPAAVLAYVRSHLPAGARVTTTGVTTGRADTLHVLLAVSGPHEDQATLLYTVGPTVSAGSSELRVDAETVWVPLRPAAERAPAGGVMTVTGYRRSSDATGSTGAVTVVVGAPAARRITRLLDSLPAGPRTMCMESVSLFTVAVRPRHGSPVSFRATTAGCAGTVSVTAGGRQFPPLVARGCALLRVVAAALPSRARSTVGAARLCSSLGATAVGPSP